MPISAHPIEGHKTRGTATQEWVEQRLGGYVRLSVEERHGAVKELKAEGLPNTKIAKVLGVNEKTVRNDSEKSESRGLKTAETSGFQAGDSEKSEPVDAMAALAVGEAKQRQSKRRERNEKATEDSQSALTILETEMEIQGRKLYSVHETAAILGCSPKSVHRLIAADLLKPVRLTGPRARPKIEPEEIEALIARRREEG